MVKIFTLFTILGILWGLPVGTAVADVDYNVEQTFKIDGTPVDIAIALNGRRVFVVNDQGYLLIYKPDGNFSEKVFIGKNFDRIKATPREDVILIGNSKEQVLQVITLRYTRNINIGSAPFKGPEEAPVEIVVFSDFQDRKSVV